MRHIPEKLMPRGHHDWPDSRSVYARTWLVIAIVEEWLRPASRRLGMDDGPFGSWGRRSPLGGHANRRSAAPAGGSLPGGSRRQSETRDLAIPPRSVIVSGAKGNACRISS